MEKQAEIRTQTEVVAKLRSSLSAKRVEGEPQDDEFHDLEMREADAVRKLTEIEAEVRVFRDMSSMEGINLCSSPALEALHAGGLHTGLLHVINTAPSDELRQKAISLLHMSINQWWGGDLPLHVSPRWQFLYNIATSPSTPEIQKAAQNALVRALNKL